MKYLEISFSCRLTTDALFSAYKGSMLRGSLGSNLRKGLCMTRGRDCVCCILARNCIFPRVFLPVMENGKTGAPPFLIEPPVDNRIDYEARELFSFKLKLFSYAVEYLPFFVQAFRMSGEKGIGNPQRPGKFAIENITGNGLPLYDPSRDSLEIPAAQDLAMPHMNDAFGQGQVLVRLITPLRHKSDNRFSGRLEFADLFHLVLRRAKTLTLMNGEMWNMDAAEFETLSRAASSIETQVSNLRWLDWSRYSSRQETSMKFGGLYGSVTFSGELAAFQHILHFARIAHIGKQTSFGLGQMEFEYL